MIYKVDPLTDLRYPELLQTHRAACVFHTLGWLEALRHTYGYQPVVFTMSAPKSHLTNGVVLCHVRSWLTGTRLVSLPFADHCELLLNNQGEHEEFIAWLREECDRQQYKYVELRPLSALRDPSNSLRYSHSYCFHELDLTRTLEDLFRGLHKDSIQRKIIRAEREGLSYETGSSDQLLDEFYRLLLITRRRHGLPPQPRSWFLNLIRCLRDGTKIRVARKNGTAIAALLTLRHRSTVVYKYGCSDEKFHNLGAMPSLFWRLIQESRATGAETLDLGRSDLNNEGLITFKNRFGATRTSISYYRYSQLHDSGKSSTYGLKLMQCLIPIMPDSVVSATGNLLYRHMG